MFAAAAIVSSVLAALLAASAMGKLTKADAVMEIMTKVAVPPDKLWLLAAAELAGSVGLVFGLFWWPIGVAAAIGVILYFLGAAVAHLRVNDRQLASVGFMLLLSIAALALRAVTA